MKHIIPILLLTSFGTQIIAQTALPNYSLSNRGRFPNNSPANTNVRQSSGLALHPNTTSFWTHNDQGFSTDKIYRFTPLAANTNSNVIITDSVTINAATNDWEEMATDDNGNMYLLDIGKNCNANSPATCPTRHVFEIHQMPFASLTNGATVTPTTFHFKYPLTGYDVTNCAANDTVFVNCESAIWFNNSMYLFSKDIWSKSTSSCGGWVSNYTYMFKVPLQSGSTAANPIIAQYMGKINLRTSLSDGNPELNLTAAAISPDKNTIALATYSRVWFLKGFTNDDFTNAPLKYYASYSDENNMPLNLRPYEGIEFVSNDTLFLSVDNTNGRVSSLNVNSPVPLPILNLKLQAIASSKTQNRVSWTTAETNVVSSYNIEVSSNGIEFTHLESFYPTNSSSNEQTYSFIHTIDPKIEKYYYRVKVNTQDNRILYTDIKSVKRKIISKFNYSILNNTLHFDVPNHMNGAKYLLINSQGQTVKEGYLSGSNYQLYIPSSGIYLLRITVNNYPKSYKVFMP